MIVTSSKEKLHYIDYLRALAIILIVAGHTMIWGKTGHSIQRTNAYFLEGATLLFVFIAGFLFQYLAYKFNYKKYLITKFKNVIMPYWITMLPIALYFAFTCNDTKNFLFDYSPSIRFFSVMLWGQTINISMWFIPMITIFYIVSPLILKLKKNKVLWYSVLFCTIYTTITVKRSGLGLGNGEISLLEWHWKHILLCSKRFLYFLPIYTLGMDICEIFEHSKNLIEKNINKIIYISLICWLYFYIYFVHLTRTAQSASNLGRIALTSLLLCLLYKFRTQIKNNRILDKVLKFIADYSFGIFFIHYYIVYALTRHVPYRVYSGPKFDGFLHKNTLHALVGSIEHFLIAFVGSLLVLFVIRKILEFVGVKNTRMFIGVGGQKKTK